MRTSALLMLGAFATACAQSPVPPRAIVFRTAPDGTFPADKLATLCAGGPTPCNPQTTRVWLGEGSPLGNTFLIDVSRPALVALRDSRVARVWDFAGYAHSRSAGEQSTGEPLELYPALYPAGADRYAVALVRNRRDAYSGGGALYAYADFVLLDVGGTPRDAPERVYAGVPFACSKMVRACFAESEYQTSRHCHEETNGYLTIGFPAEAASTPDALDWKFTWHQSDWPAHVNKAHARRLQTRFTLPAAVAAQDIPRNVPFCDAPR